MTAHDYLEFSLYVVSLIFTDTSKELMAVLQVYVHGAVLVMHIHVSAIEFIICTGKSSIAPQDSTTSCTISGCLHSPTAGVIEVVRMLVLGVLARCVIYHHMVLLHYH